MADKKDRGMEFLGSNIEDFDFDPDGDGSRGTRYSDGRGSYYGADGSRGTRYSDGSASYFGADGSRGIRYSDGSGSYFGADGSRGTLYSDGSGSFFGADGSRGTRYSDGSSSFYSADGHLKTRSADEPEFSYGNDSNDSSYDSSDYDIDDDEGSYSTDYSYHSYSGFGGGGLGFYSFNGHWKGIIIAILILLVCAFGYFKYSDYKNRIEVGVSSEELIGLDYNTVKNKLSDSGFTNIHEKAITDLSIEDIDKEGIVTQVSIRGKVDVEKISFSKSDRFPYDAYIKIIFHELDTIEVPMESKKMKKLNYVEAQQKFTDAGFINVKTVAEHDLVTGWINKDGSVDSISVDGKTSFESYNQFRPDVEVIIKYHTFK